MISFACSGVVILTADDRAYIEQQFHSVHREIGTVNRRIDEAREDSIRFQAETKQGHAAIMDEIKTLASLEDLNATNKRMDWWVNLSAVTLIGFVGSLMKALYDLWHPPK